ncbi:alpha/beta hydrolase [uncultured Pelagimonas sp.]|uniref:alpha/beta hydrolase n=1 Tax=uncultured Pelagimonas sp. TaxID=1618102 RepID=UPI00262CEE8B|nr:alpha/beta hydrolase [uncultured Pelagimonas sp.]
MIAEQGQNTIFTRVVAICAIVLLALVTGCGRAPDLIGIDNPEIPVASVKEATLQKVFLATTRQPTEVAGAFFSEKRAPELGLASVQVSVPPNRLPGELRRPKVLPPDPRKEYAVIDPVRYGTEAAFVRSVNAELAKLPAGKRDILFFVHGYNNTTSDAVLRLAQFVQDSEFEGVPVLFDWASAASLIRYVYDLNSALIARPQVRELARILDKTNAEGYDVFAHSMGAFLTMEAMVDQVQRGQLNKTKRLRSIVLASPDIDMDLFRTQIGEIGPETHRLFVLMSQDDGALKFSRRIAGGVPRVGASNAQELADLGVVAIDLSEIEDSASGNHSKFAGSPEVVKILGRGLNRSRSFDVSERPTHLQDMLRGIPITVVFR